MSDGTTALTTANGSLFLGDDTKASANGNTNEIVIGTDAIGNGISYLFYNVALQVRHGFDEKEALKSVTINPARAFGIDKRVGSLEPGKDADIVILSGPPFDILSLTEMVLVEGEIVYTKKEIK